MEQKIKYQKINLGKTPKRCFKCNAPIGFVQLKNNCWQPITAQPIEDEWEIIINKGNYGNYNPRHQCITTIKEQEEKYKELKLKAQQYRISLIELKADMKNEKDLSILRLGKIVKRDIENKLKEVENEVKRK